MRAGVTVEYDGLQQLYSYSERTEGPGVMWYIGSQQQESA
jgi:hypothetical protein